MLIKQSDYHRIYRVINSLLVNENANPATASMYFSTFGAFILKHHFKIEAKPQGGLAAYNLGGKLVFFADHREDGHVSGGGENFHCWVEAQGWAIDFMAPALSQAAPALQLPSKMFQKPLTAMARSVNELVESGDFFFKAEPDAMAARFSDWRKQPLIGDLATVASSWFRVSPRKMPATIISRDQHDVDRPVPLIGNLLIGAW